MSEYITLTDSCHTEEAQSLQPSVIILFNSSHITNKFIRGKPGIGTEIIYFSYFIFDIFYKFEPNVQLLEALLFNRP